MNADKTCINRYVSAFVFVQFWLLLAACSQAPTPTLFRPPTRPLSPQPLPATPAASLLSPTSLPSLEPGPTPPCTNDLKFLQDLTIPDGTSVTAGSSIDKRWLVTNSGTCDWDARYRLKFTGGDSFGAVIEQALYPARAGTQATLRILFTSPSQPGNYQSAWQAFGPDGIAFGDVVYLQIVVQP
jgi:hypothetical protein